VIRQHPQDDQAAQAVANKVRLLDFILLDETGQPTGVFIECLGDGRVIENERLHTVLALEMPLDQVHPGPVRPEAVRAHNGANRVHVFARVHNASRFVHDQTASEASHKGTQR
jgi:hypothetical protein